MGPVGRITTVTYHTIIYLKLNKMINKIPSAADFYYQMTGCVINHKDIETAMIEFAKLHVKAALQEALESIPCLGSSTDIPTYDEVETEVLSAYPSENIK
jgi:hypothetical protein